MLMEFYMKGRTVVDIKATVTNLDDIIPNMLPAGCDTVAMYHSIGKGKMMKTLKVVMTLSVF